MKTLKTRHAHTALPALTAEQLEHQDKALQAAFGILKDKVVFASDVISPDKRPLTPEIIARLGPHKTGIIAGFGALKNTGVFPEDALEYQLEVRAEWD